MFFVKNFDYGLWDPEVVDKLRKLQFFPEYGTPEDLRKEMVDQQRIIRDVAGKAGILQGQQK